MRICFVGDSFVNGTCDPDCLGWTGRVCAAARKQGYNLTYYNLGVRGETSADIASRWHSEVSRRLPESVNGRVVFSFGTNDTTLENGKTRVKLDDSTDNIRKILTAAKPLFPVLMVSPAPIANAAQNSRTAQLSQRFYLVSNQLGIPYLDVFHPLQASPIWMKEVATNDGAHPGSAGYLKLAQLVQRWSAWLSWFYNSGC